MSYADITTNDPNPIKRFLQKRRLWDALRFTGDLPENAIVLDFGGGDGQFCKMLSEKNHAVNIICFEPAGHIRAQAESTLAATANCQVISDLSSLEESSVDVIIALEVFEHLPSNETELALQKIQSLLKKNGRLVIGVPNELYVAAFYKGLFRFLRRRGEFDAQLKTISQCIIGKPPAQRPIGEISPGRAFHFHHTGFDYRQFEKKLESMGASTVRRFSPLAIAGLLNPELYYLVSFD